MIQCKSAVIDQMFNSMNLGISNSPKYTGNGRHIWNKSALTMNWDVQKSLQLVCGECFMKKWACKDF